MLTIVPGPCPVCNAEIEYLYQTDNIPYFSDIIMIRALCPKCGYRYVDTQVLTTQAPGRQEFLIETPDDIDVRVVRSMEGIVMIPELGVRIDPGPACEGFVSNIEGVLNRVTEAVEGVMAHGDATERENARIFLEDVAAVKRGERPVTLIIDDPSGNSAIISEKTRKLPYPEDEGEGDDGDDPERSAE
ncbi:MAG: ZPR1 zinc finger domain-containing protein [Methanomicrobiales archaeon]